MTEFKDRHNRKLATIQKILSLEEIPGADMILKATVLGWDLVVKKDEFNVGDKCVYIEIDSILPDRPEFEFLKDRHFRIKTVRLKGQISQGIAFPLTILPEDIRANVVEGQDVTDVLGIELYQPPLDAALAGQAKGVFPWFLQKSDECRIQVLQPLLDKYKGTECVVTEKVDGASCTIYFKDGNFGVCSRNIELKDTKGNTFWDVTKKFEIEKKLRARGQNITLQGELIGEGIRKNKLKIKGQAILFFNLFDHDKFKYYDYEDFKRIVAFELGLPIVPVISEKYILGNSIPDLVQFSIGPSLLAPSVMREGIVVRPLKEITDHQISNGYLTGDRVSFKVLNPNYLLRFEE